MILEKPIKCSYFTYETPDEYQGKKLTDQEQYALLAEGIIETKVISHAAIIFRIDKVNITNLDVSLRQDDIAATVVDVNTGKIEVYKIEELEMDFESLKYLSEKAM